MGIFDFIRNAGRKREDPSDAPAAPPAETAEEKLAELRMGNAILRTILSMELDITNPMVEVDDGTATLRGAAADQATREKIVLIAGNTQGVARVDDQVNNPALGTPLRPRRPHPDSLPDQHRPVKLAPAIGPVIGHLGGNHLNRLAADHGIEAAQVGQLTGAAIDRELHPVAERGLLHPVRGQHRQLRQHELCLFGTAANRQADQVKALRSREKKPFSLRGVRLSAVIVAASCSASSRCSSSRPTGTTTLK